VTYYYLENVNFSTWHSESGIDISFYNEDRPDTLAPFKPEDLPPDEWIWGKRSRTKSGRSICVFHA